MHFYKSGIFYYYGFKDLKEPRISLPISLISIKADGVCKTSIPYQVIKASYNKRRAPAISRFKNTFKD